MNVFYLLFLMALSTVCQAKLNFGLSSGISIFHTHHYQCELDDKSYHRGMSSSRLLQLDLNFNRFSLYTGIEHHNAITNHTKFSQYFSIPIALQFDVLKTEKLDAFVEGGIARIISVKSFDMNPFFLGVRYKRNQQLSLISKVRFPKVTLLTDDIGTFNFVEIGVDLLLRVQLFSKKRRKVIGREEFPCIRY